MGIRGRVFLTDPGGLAAERYKVLRRQLCALKPGGGIVLLTSPAPADGKTLTSINLAFSLAEQGHSTCLVTSISGPPGVFPNSDIAQRRLMWLIFCRSNRRYRKRSAG